jgi:hypothetical protein
VRGRQFRHAERNTRLPHQEHYIDFALGNSHRNQKCLIQLETEKGPVEAQKLVKGISYEEVLRVRKYEDDAGGDSQTDGSECTIPSWHSGHGPGTSTKSVECVRGAGG